MEDTLDLSVLEVAGITSVMLISTFIDEVNPWITAGLGVFGISWLVYRFFLSQKVSKVTDARESREKERELREKERELREKEKELREKERELREKKEHENTLKIQELQIKKLEKDIEEDPDKESDDANHKPGS